MNGPVGEGHIQCEKGENPILKLTEHFYDLGCREFAVEDGILWLRWPDGKQQKVVIGEGVRVQ